MKKIIAYALAFTLVITNIGFINAKEIPEETPNLILSQAEIDEINIYIDELKAENKRVEMQRNAAGALGAFAGSFYIPGVGPAVVTIGGAIIVAGVVVTASSAIGKKVINWVKTHKIQ